jgi:hypothetical protein
MRTLADPGPADPGRRIWAASGLITAAALIAGTVLLITPAPDSPQNAFARPRNVPVQGISAQAVQAEATTTRTVTVPQRRPAPGRPLAGLPVVDPGQAAQRSGRCQPAE